MTSVHHGFCGENSSAPQLHQPCSAQRTQVARGHVDDASARHLGRWSLTTGVGYRGASSWLLSMVHGGLKWQVRSRMFSAWMVNQWMVDQCWMIVDYSKNLRQVTYPQWRAHAHVTPYELQATRKQTRRPHDCSESFAAFWMMEMFLGTRWTPNSSSWWCSSWGRSLIKSVRFLILKS